MKKGFTLVELLVVMAVMALMAAVTLPAITKMINSNKEGAAMNLIRSALIEAQVHAAKTQKYAGIRFQFDKNGWQAGKQYLVLVEQGTTQIYHTAPNVNATAVPGGVAVVAMNYDQNAGLDDASTFVILFSPTGQLIVKYATVLPRDETDTIINNAYRVERDPVLVPNSSANHPAILYCDDTMNDSIYGNNIPSKPWCHPEYSEKGFYITDTSNLRNSDSPDNVLNTIKPTLINLYTGGIIRD